MNLYTGLFCGRVENRTDSYNDTTRQSDETKTKIRLNSIKTHL